jgi:hypothetical protein
MSYLHWNMLLNFSIVLPVLAAVKRFKQVGPEGPFVWLLVIGLVNELTSFFLITKGQANSINGNLYILTEHILLLLQFLYWQAYSRRIFEWLLLTGTVLWAADNFMLHRIADDNSLFRIYHSLVIVFLAAMRIKHYVAAYEGRIYTDTCFIICCGLLLYFGCKAFLESFNAFHAVLSPGFYRQLYMILCLANAISNIMFLIAILCMQPKRAFMLRL